MVILLLPVLLRGPFRDQMVGAHGKREPRTCMRAHLRDGPCKATSHIRTALPLAGATQRRATFFTRWMMSRHLTPSTWVPSSASWWSQVSGATASRAHCWMRPVTACASKGSASQKATPESTLRLPPRTISALSACTCPQGSPCIARTRMAASMFADTCEFAAVGDTQTLDRTDVPRQASPAVPRRTSGLIHMQVRAAALSLMLLTSIAHAGTWGEGSFENDDALDWASECTSAKSVAPVSAALALVSRDKSIEAPDGSAAVAAAEVVAAALGRPNPKLPSQLRDWIIRQPSAQLVALAPSARTALMRVANAEISELAKLWSARQPNKWTESISELQARLKEQ